MKLPARPGEPRSLRPGKGEAGFTLAEVLAAMLFMAIVVPVAVQGLRVASLAGEVAQRKTQAMRIAERVLHENFMGTNTTQSSLSGTVYEGTRPFQWTLRTEQWMQHLTNRLSTGASALNQLGGGQPAVDQLALGQITMNLLSVEVRYPVQNSEYTVRLSTLMPLQ